MMIGNEEMGEEQVEVQDESGQDNGVGVNGVGIESDGGQGQDGGDVDAVASNKGILDTPRNVGTLKSQWLKYLQSLCDDVKYQSLLSLLKTAKVYIWVVVSKIY